MPFTKRLLLLILVLLLAGAVIVCLMPVMVADGIRLFVLWKSEPGIKIELGQIESPLFKPVVIHRIRVTSTHPCPFHLAFEAPTAQLKLNLRALISGSGARIIRGLSVDGLSGDVERIAPVGSTTCQFDWRLLHTLLADDLRLTNFNLRVRNGNTRVELRNVDLSASEIETGRFTARSIYVDAPWFHREFPNLRGATSWENDRLTIGALSLARGLDVETITADLSRLENKRIGLELNLDAFGGKLRASLASESREEAILWDVAGTASEISLAQMSAALRLTEPASGSVRASKFTFRGGPQNLFHATASVWMEVSGFTWRDRQADTVMLGASLYNRQVDIEQLYVKQRNNQLTLSGEYTLPTKSSDWVNPDFRADIFASINDLGDFGRLFGAPPDSFSGSIFISGMVNGRDRNIGGHIVLDGESLRVFSMPADNLSARMTLKGAHLTIDELKARHNGNSLEATGNADLSHEHQYSGKLKAKITNVADYWPLLPQPWRALEPDGDISIEWNGHGDAATHSGDFRVQGQGIRVTSRFGLLPFEAEMSGSYTPKNTFFRDFHFSNGQADFSALATFAPSYVQLQTLHFDLNGKTKLSGNVFLPIALTQWMKQGPTLEAFDRNQSFDVDLDLDPTDLSELTVALCGYPKWMGTLRGRLTAYNPLSSLQSTFEGHLRDFSKEEPARISADLQGHVLSDSLTFNLSAIPTNSDPVRLEATLPLQLDRSGTGSVIALDQPFSATLDFPAIALTKLPQNLAHGIFRDGILNGKLVATQSLRRPHITGEVQLLTAKLIRRPGAATGASGRLILNGSSASLEFAKLESMDGQIRFHGSLDFADTSRISARLIPDAPLWNFGRLPADTCVSNFNFFQAKRSSSDHQSDWLLPEIERVDLRGAISGDRWTLTLLENAQPNFSNASRQISRSFPLCQTNGQSLELGFLAARENEFGHDATSLFEGRKTLEPAPNSLQLERP